MKLSRDVRIIGMLLATLLAGCNRDTLHVPEIRGEFISDGKPQSGVRVLAAAGENAECAEMREIAVTDRDGNFHVKASNSAPTDDTYYFALCFEVNGTYHQGLIYAIHKEDTPLTLECALPVPATGFMEDDALCRSPLTTQSR